jgi:cell fate (sporulation/competence/biofilm development) regulator YlbF (YheA/YmcA/DUF963 family)
MISTEPQNAADVFVTALETDESISAFREAKRRFDQNEELKALRTTYSERLPELQRKQADGTLTQEDINAMRSLQEKINGHPVTVEMLRTQEQATKVLQESNSTISEILGFDFSATAASPAGCC